MSTAGIIGTIQSNEVIKYLTGTGDLLTNRLFLWDGMQSHAEEIRIERNPSCEACSGMGKENKIRGEEMTVKIRFFAQFRELLGSDISN